MLLKYITSKLMLDMPSASKPTEPTLLTEREIELLLSLRETASIKFTAQQLKISYKRAQKIKANIQRKWKLGVNTNNYLLNLIKGHRGFQKLMLSVGRSSLLVATAKGIDLEEKEGWEEPEEPSGEEEW